MSLESACIGFIACNRHWIWATATSGDGDKLLSRGSLPAFGIIAHFVSDSDMGELQGSLQSFP